MTADRMTFRQAALMTGASLLVMAIVSGTANFQVIEGLKSSLAPGGSGVIPAAMAGPGRLAAMAFLAAAMLDIVAAWGFYEMFRAERPALSLLTAWFRLVYAAVFAVSVAFLFGAFRLVPSSPEAAAAAFRSFEDAWTLGLLAFSVHLALLGWLIVRSKRIHWIFGILAIVAGLGYAVDSVTSLLVPGGGTNAAVVAFVGEVALIIWLLVRGFRPKAE